MGTTIKDIAKKANVSVSTVSRALNNKGYISKKTKKKIIRIADSLSYKPNYIAQSLQSGVSNTICLLIPNIQGLVFPDIAQGVEDVARENGYTVVLCNSNDNAETERKYIDLMLKRQIDGFVICSAKKGEANVFYMIENDIPCTIVNRYRKEFLNKVDCVGIDNRQALEDAVNYLYKRGYRKFAFAKGDQDLSFNYERYHGFLSALKKLNLELNSDWIMEKANDDFYKETIELMSSEEKPDCIIASTDQKAFYILSALNDLKMKIPEEVGLLGFDNLSMSEIIKPSLSTVYQPLYEYGRVACMSVLKQIEHKKEYGKLPKPRKHIMDYKIVARKTTR